MHRLPSRGVLALLAVSLAIAAPGQTPPSAKPPAKTSATPRQAAPPEAKPQPHAEKAGRAAPLAPASLDVAVTDAAGKPIEGVFVVAIPVGAAYRPSGELATEKVRSTLTSRDGKARLEALPPGPWTVGLHARGFVTQSLKRVHSGPLAARLERGGAITGVVRETEGKRPVAGARVGVVGGMPVPSAWSNEATRNETTTDRAGRFRLEGIGRSPVTIAARARGFGRAERTDVRAGASVELFLFPGASLAGVVRDDAGRPVAGAEVRAEGDWSWGAPPPERSDARGEFRVDGVQPGEYTVVAREGARAPGIAVVVVEPAAEASVPLTVSDGGYATGRLVDGEARPIAGRVRVQAFDGRTLPSFASDLLAADAKADGTFALGPLPLGSLGVEASAPRFATRRVEAEVPARGRTVDLGEIALEVGLSIRGRVRDREGNGVAGAEVRAARHGAGAPSEGEALSEADGSFLVGGLEAGTHDVWASAPGWAPASATATSGGEPLDLVLEPGGEIAGRVVDADGSPVEDAQVSAEGKGRPPGADRHFAGRTDEGDGRFVVRDVAEGKYALEVRAASRGEASLTDVRVAAGRTTNVGTIELARGGTLQGVVVDAEGSGIPGATVGAERDANRRHGRFRTQTGSTGAFELRGLPVGAVYVSAWHPAYAPAPEVAATVDPDKEPAQVRIVLPRGGTIEGRALYRDGRPFVGGRVSCQPLDPRARRIGLDNAAIAADGSFVLDHVPAGRTMVTLMAFTPASAMVYGPAANILTSVAAREVEVREGERAFADLALRDVVVAGRVTRGGQPEPGVLVSVMTMTQGSILSTWNGSAAARLASPGPPPLATTTRDDGGYELLVFTPGPAHVELHGGGQSYPDRELEIPDADRFELDLEIGGATVSGIVVDREGGAPVAGAFVGLRKEGGTGGTGGESSPDGRFSIAVEPGEYRLEARARDRQPASQVLGVGPAGVADLRIEMEQGLDIRGRLLDLSGRPAAGHLTVATAADGDGYGSSNSAADGTFRIGGLGAKPHAIVAGSELAGYAFRPGVTPGGQPIALTLQPAGRIAVHVLDAAGQPVRDAYPRVEAIDGARVRMRGRISGPTDSSGLYELAAPAGTVEVSVRADAGTGGGSTSVRPGETVPLTVVLEPKPPKQP